MCVRHEYLCPSSDVKLEHFGLLRDRMVIIDADTVFPKSIVSRSTADNRACTNHEDCDLFDCHSLCNKVIGRCDTSVVNNNLQVIQVRLKTNSFVTLCFLFVQMICQKIFIEAGLLISQNLPAAKRKLLEECANPYYSNGRQSAPIYIHNELFYFFQEFLQIVI